MADGDIVGYVSWEDPLSPTGVMGGDKAVLSVSSSLSETPKNNFGALFKYTYTGEPVLLKSLPVVYVTKKICLLRVSP